MPMRAIGTIDIGLIGLNLTVVLPMTGTLTIGRNAAGPSLIALLPMAGTPMIGKGAAVTVPFGSRGKFPEIQQSTAASTSTAHCSGPFH
jgi:hypothetical protein